MGRKKKIGGFTIEVKHPKMPSDAWAPTTAERPEEEEERKKRDGRHHLDTLLEAEEIRSNPEKLKYAMEHADERATKIKSLKDLRVVSEAKFGSNTQDERKAKAKG